jgi:hypothetical protein
LTSGIGSRCAPQCGQVGAPAGTGRPHWSQNTVAPPRSLWPPPL